MRENVDVGLCASIDVRCAPGGEHSAKGAQCSDHGNEGARIGEEPQGRLDPQPVPPLERVGDNLEGHPKLHVSNDGSPECIPTPGPEPDDTGMQDREQAVNVARGDELGRHGVQTCLGAINIYATMTSRDVSFGAYTRPSQARL